MRLLHFKVPVKMDIVIQDLSSIKVLGFSEGTKAWLPIYKFNVAPILNKELPLVVAKM